MAGSVCVEEWTGVVFIDDDVVRDVFPYSAFSVLHVIKVRVHSDLSWVLLLSHTPGGLPLQSFMSRYVGDLYAACGHLFVFMRWRRELELDFCAWGMVLDSLNHSVNFSTLLYVMSVYIVVWRS